MGKVQNSSSESHKFDNLMKQPLTFREYFGVEFTSQFIPYLRLLEKEIGHDKVIQSLQQLSIQEAEEYAREVTEARGKNDLSIFKENYNPSTPTLTLEVLEDTEDVYCIQITECLWADCFRQANAADLGLAAVCSGDAPFARFVNPQIDLDIEGTLMEGKPYCKLRYYVKKRASGPTPTL
ncbi:MAG TPA: L-2-amino-thiazoline-4-carboxylic acid hydrolase [Longilinea sp.]|nr:L-2-amino-thiazoline-4-carboxylic acid hydrolase [Longilinea sp.]